MLTEKDSRQVSSNITHNVKFIWNNGIRTRDLHDTGAMLYQLSSFWNNRARELRFL